MKKNTLVYILFAMYCGLVANLVFMQHNHDSDHRLTSENIYEYVNVIPFHTILSGIDILYQKGFKNNMNVFNNIIGNIIMFMPLPYFLIRCFAIKKAAQLLLYGFIISFTIETVQYLGILGVPDIDDVILNVLGTYIGWLLIVLRIKLKNNNVVPEDELNAL